MPNLADFRKTYPHCTLTSEFLLVEHGQFLVRCAVEQQGRQVATGLSAAATVEMAEDQARDRALTLLSQIGVPPLPSPPAAIETLPQPAAPPAPIPNPIPAVSESSQPLQSTLTEATVTPTPPIPQPEPVPPVEVVEPVEPEPIPAASVNETETPPLPSLPIEEAAVPLAPEEAAAVLPTPAPPTQPNSPPPTRPDGSIDCIELIARTNREIQRLGWTNEQGKTYLLQTYGKQARSRLDDHELIEFLQYLEAQP